MDAFNILTFVVGLFGGATAAYLILQAKAAQAVAEAVGAQKELEVRAVAEAAAAQQRVNELVARLAKFSEDLEAKDSTISHQNIAIADTRVALKEQETLAHQLPELKKLIEDKDRALQQKEHELTQLKTAQTTFESRVAEFQRQQDELKNAFAKLATDALQKNNEIFIQRAKAEMDKSQASGQTEIDKRSKSFEELVKPIKEGLEKYDQKITQFEKERSEAFGAVTNHLKTVAFENERLKTETSKLVNALRGAPTVRGFWGELELRPKTGRCARTWSCTFPAINRW
jgi:DNA anti-recombination protein RmuC